MKALVTGGAGHIGSHVVDQLVASGSQVTVLDDLSAGTLDNLTQCRDNIRFVEGSACDVATLADLVPTVDVVFHLAAVVGVRQVLADPSAAIETNVDGTRAVVAACAHSSTRLVFASTSEVYGRTPTIPMRENDDLVIGAPTSARWSYALGKALDEHLVLDAGRAGLPVSVLRYFNSYGPRAASGRSGSVVARFISQALDCGPITVYGDGSQVRSLTHVHDVAAATVAAGSDPLAIGGVFNVGTETPTTIQQLARTIAELVGKATHTPPAAVISIDPASDYGQGFDETHTRIASNEHIRTTLGWTPRIALADGLLSTVEWHLDRSSRPHG